MDLRFRILKAELQACNNCTGALVSRLNLIEDWSDLARRSGYDATEMARICDISASQLRRYFGKVFRRPPQEWINELRMWDAMQMLSEGRTVSDVAAELKFANVAHLSQRYKEYHGHPPSEFRSYLKSRRGMAVADDDQSLRPWQDAELRLLSPLQRRQN